ncbi:MAG: HEPN domain-containing protein [Draconibacterium sp.]|nr:HEPN domain-containing protein [Draconibacterium sp.]
MSYDKTDLIRYRLEKSERTFQEAKSLSDSGFWNGAANRLYYSCFYEVIALLAKDNVNALTHNGVRVEFFKRYVKTEILSRDFSNFYSNIMGKRQESDYDDFLEFSKNDIKPLFPKTIVFINGIKELLKD